MPDFKIKPPGLPKDLQPKGPGIDKIKDAALQASLPPGTEYLGSHTDESGLLRIYLFRSVSPDLARQHTRFGCTVPEGMICIGGGGEGVDSPYGALLTASYPAQGDMRTWLVSTSDCGAENPHRAVAYAIGFQKGTDEPAFLRDLVRINRTQTSGQNMATMNVPNGDVLVGGGFELAQGYYATDVGGYATSGWHVTCREQRTSFPGFPQPGPAPTIPYITLFTMSVPRVVYTGTFSSTSTPSAASEPTASAIARATLPNNYVMTGGWGVVGPNQNGNLLWKLAPSLDGGAQSFVAASKDLGVNSPAVLNAGIFGLKFTPK